MQPITEPTLERKDCPERDSYIPEVTQQRVPTLPTPVPYYAHEPGREIKLSQFSGTNLYGSEWFVTLEYQPFFPPEHIFSAQCCHVPTGPALSPPLLESPGLQLVSRSLSCGWKLGGCMTIQDSCDLEFLCLSAGFSVP